MAEELIGTGFRIVGSVSAKLKNTITSTYDKEVDQMFGRLQKDQDKKYDANDYERVGFDNKRAVSAFVEEMNRQDIEVTVSPVKLNGQYLVELPKTIIIASDDDEQGRTVTARELIAQYERDNFVEVHSANHYKEENDKEDIASYETSSLNRFINSQLDDLGKTISGIQSAVKTISDYCDVNNANRQMFDTSAYEKAEYQHRKEYDDQERANRIAFDKQQEDLKVRFESSENKRFNDFIEKGGKEEDFVRQEFVKEEYKAQSTYQPLDIKDFGHSTLHTRHTHTAVVIGDNVIVNGQLVDREKDGKTYDYCMEQVRQREQTADNILSKESRYADKHSHSDDGVLSKREISHEARRLNAENIKSGIYEEPQVVVSNEVKYRSTRERELLDNLASSLNTANVATSLGNEAFAREKEMYDIITADINKSLVDDAFKNGNAIAVNGRNSGMSDKAIIGNFFTDKDFAFSARQAGFDAVKDASLYKALVDKAADNGDKLVLSYRNKGMTDEEIVRMLSHNEKFIKNAESWGYTIRLENGGSVILSKTNTPLAFTKRITGADLVRFNNNFIERAAGLGYQFVMPNGKFDVASLKKLSKSELKKLGLTPELRDMLAKLNTAGAFGKNQFATSFVGTGLKLATKMAQDEDLSKIINTSQKTISYGKKAVTSARQFSEYARAKIDIAKAKHAGKTSGKTNFKKKGNNAAKNANARANAAAVRKVDSAANAKYAAKMARKEVASKKAAKNVFAKFDKLKTQAMKKLAETAIGKTLSAISTAVSGFITTYLLPILGIIVGVLSIIIAVIFVILVIVESIAAFGGEIKEKLTPDIFDQSAAYHLVTSLEKAEGKWVDGLYDVDKWFDHKDTYAYGTDGQTLEVYVKNFGEQIFTQNKGKKLYINPFSSVSGLVTPDNTNKNALTVVDKFDGKHSVEIVANDNKRTVISDADSSYQPLAAGQNGHTSNVKDIVAMIDIMYGMELNEANETDGSMSESRIGESPAALAWETFKDTWTAIWDNVGTFFNHLAGGDDPYTDMGSIQGKSFRTMANYAAHLFQVSHQQQLFFDGILYHENGLTETGDAVVNNEIGLCTNPAKNEFKIYRNTGKGRIAPYLEKGVLKYDLTNGKADYGFAIDISMDDLVTPEPKGKMVCLRDNFGSDKQTWEVIDGEFVEGKANGCWTRKRSPQTVTLTASVGDGYTSATSAKQAAEAAVLSKFAAVQASCNDKFVLSPDWDSFNATRYGWNYGETYTPKSSATKHTHTRAGSCHSGCTQPCNSYHKGSDYYTYSATATLTYKFYIDTYTRNCKMHDFKYCGGHLNLTTKGIVFSMTNEQMAACGAYNTDDEYPVIKDYDFEKYGYSSIIGKHHPNAKAVTCLYDYVTSWVFGGLNPANDVQGSRITYQQGLNLHVKGSSETFESGFYVKQWTTAAQQDDVVNASVTKDIYYQMRDIFDADCLVLKGKNTLPCGSHYEDYKGWDDGNMSLALLKTTADWSDIYGIDTPTEIGTMSLSTTKDIPAIIESLRGNPNNKLTPQREEAVKVALTWVGRGHYSKDHQSHAFLTELCDVNDKYLSAEATHTFDCNCTASDDKGFITFVLNRAAANIAEKNAIESGKEYSYTNDMNIVNSKVWNNYNSVANLSSASVVWRTGDGERNYSNAKKIVDAAGTQDQQQTIEAIRSYTEDRYVFYVGTLSTPVTLSNARGKKTNAVTIPAGVPLFIDLNVSEGVGNVRLRTVTPTSIADADADTNYYWLFNPNGKIKYRILS